MVFLARGGTHPHPCHMQSPPGLFGQQFWSGHHSRWGGILPKFYAGRFRPEVQSLTLLYTIFERKGPLSFTVYWQMSPLSPKKFEPLLSAVNALSLKHELITKLESFMDFFTSIKRICRPFRAFLQTEMTDFPTLLSVASTSDSLPYHIPEA